MQTKRSPIVNIGLVLCVLLLGSVVACAGTRPQERLSWEEQVARIQQAVAAEDSNATLDNINARVFFVDEEGPDADNRTSPFPVANVGVAFVDSEGQQLYVAYYDTVITHPLTIGNLGAATIAPVSPTINLTQLPAMVKIGPLDACLSALTTAQQLTGANTTQMLCQSSLRPYGIYTNEFNIPAVWHITWFSHQDKKEDHAIDIWIDAATKERLRVMKDGSIIEAAP